MFQAFLIKYAEIAMKGKNRFMFEDALVRQTQRALKHADGSFNVYKTQGRIHVECDGEYDYDETVEALQKVFGITAFCPTIVLDDEGFEVLKKRVVEYVGEEYPDKNFTFKVLARRARKNYPLESMEICAKIGEALLDAYPEMKVDVHKPEVFINVEIREKIYLYSKEIKGAAGMPIGTGGKAMLLLSGGIDSPVAGYMVAKRGVVIEAVYFHAPPYTSERAKQKVADLATIISAYCGDIKLHVINFTEIQKYIYDACPKDELTIIMRRYMMRIAQAIAVENNCLGLVTGESIGQVASQTMQSLLCTNDVCEIPVYRPLIAFDKQDIVDISEKIGAYETSILPYEDCCTIWVAEHPVTKPNVNVIRRHEKNLSEHIDEMVARALETREIIEIKK